MTKLSSFIIEFLMSNNWDNDIEKLNSELSKLLLIQHNNQKIKLLGNYLTYFYDQPKPLYNYKGMIFCYIQLSSFNGPLYRLLFNLETNQLFAFGKEKELANKLSEYLNTEKIEKIKLLAKEVIEVGYLNSNLCFSLYQELEIYPLNIQSFSIDNITFSLVDCCGYNALFSRQYKITRKLLP